MTPIRVGLIGLSGASPEKYEGTSWSAIAHLPYLRASPDYKIVALLNSSVESAQAAIKKYDLPAETKAYGDPKDLAVDNEVDLVVASVRVDRHLLVVRPSIEAGKTAFVEWPLDRNLAVAREMAALASQHNAKSIVGLQGSYAPVIQKLKETIKSGAIGRILSSTLLGSLSNGGPTESKNVRYFLDRDVGGNIVSIHAGHILESLSAALGELQSFDSAAAINYPTKDIIDASQNNRILVKDAPNTVPDQIRFWGLTADSRAPVTVHLSGGKGIPGQPALDWRIQGTEGWLHLTASGTALNVGAPELSLKLYRTGADEIGEELVLDKDQWDELSMPARNIARVYEAFRKGEWYPDFEWGLKRHEYIEKIWERFDALQGK